MINAQIGCERACADSGGLDWPGGGGRYVRYKARMTGQRLFLGDMTGAGRPKAGPKALAVAEQPAAARMKSGL